ncbi:MAG: tetratricopeptide repeat protein [Flavobacteriales bacterium]
MRKLKAIASLIFLTATTLLGNTNAIKIDSILTKVSDYQESIMLMRNVPEDDLLIYLKKPNKNLSLCKIYNALCWINFNSNPRKAMEYAKLQNAISERLNNNIIKVASYDNLAWLYQGFSDYENAIKYMIKGLKAKEALNDSKGISVSLSGLAAIHYKMKNYELALKYFNQTYELEKESGNWRNEAITLGNMGLCYVGLNKVDKGLETYLSSVKINNDHDAETNSTTTYSNIGLIYLNDKQDYNTALVYFKKAEKNILKEPDVNLQASIYAHMSEAYSLQHDFTNALIYGKKAVKYAELSGDMGSVLNSNESLSKVFYTNKNYQLAYEHFKIAYDLKDTLFNENSLKQITEMQTKYDTEKKEAENSLLKAKTELDKAELDKKSSQQKMLLMGLGLAMLIVGYVVYSLNAKKKINKILNSQNEEITSKNILIEEKNKDITDSINYAKRIQDAILPSSTELNKHLKDGFVLYLPKDIVAGDFYWMEVLDDSILLAAADCTGHGVPGAMVSVVCNSALNRAVGEFHLTQPAEILNKVRELVIETFEQSGEEMEVRDGMDISLVKFDRNLILDHTIEWAGANNPLWIVRTNDRKEAELIEYKPNKQPIGKHFKQDPFKNHRIKLQKHDTIYLFTDGYADQFGGEKGKKMMYKPFKELLLSIQEKTMDEQKIALEQFFTNWKGDLEQVDDVCIIGVRFA